MEHCARINGNCKHEIYQAGVYTFSTCPPSINIDPLSVPYPFLGDMQPLHRAAFYSVCAIVNVLLFEIANAIHFTFDKQRGHDVRRAKKQAEGKSE